MTIPLDQEEANATMMAVIELVAVYIMLVSLWVPILLCSEVLANQLSKVPEKVGFPFFFAFLFHTIR